MRSTTSRTNQSPQQTPINYGLQLFLGQCARVELWSHGGWYGNKEIEWISVLEALIHNVCVYIHTYMTRKVGNWKRLNPSGNRFDHYPWGIEHSIKRWASGLIHQASSSKHQASSIKHQTQVFMEQKANENFISVTITTFVDNGGQCTPIQKESKIIT